jgi:hypothetical protein
MGQTSAQEPQSMHLLSSITYWLSPWEIASTGQFGSQAPQDTHSLLILYAIDNNPPFYVSAPVDGFRCLESRKAVRNQQYSIMNIRKIKTILVIITAR